jgi:hypothetical protein
VWIEGTSYASTKRLWSHNPKSEGKSWQIRMFKWGKSEVSEPVAAAFGLWLFSPLTAALPLNGEGGAATTSGRCLTKSLVKICPTTLERGLGVRSHSTRRRAMEPPTRVADTNRCGLKTRGPNQHLRQARTSGRLSACHRVWTPPLLSLWDTNAASGAVTSGAALSAPSPFNWARVSDGRGDRTPEAANDSRGPQSRGCVSQRSCLVKLDWVGVATF